MAKPTVVTKSPTPATPEFQIDTDVELPALRTVAGPWRDLAEKMKVGNSVGGLKRTQANYLKNKLRSIGKKATERAEGNDLVRVFVLSEGNAIPAKKPKTKKAAPTATPVAAPAANGALGDEELDLE
jgi:hypothetical protein